jgi:hypothetical protein
MLQEKNNTFVTVPQIFNLAEPSAVVIVQTSQGLERHGEVAEGLTPAQTTLILGDSETRRSPAYVCGLE